MKKALVLKHKTKLFFFLLYEKEIHYNYFKTRPYPVVEYYAFFNDIYFYNPDTGLQSDNLPSHWFSTEKYLSLGDLKKIRVK